jgi:hypothetical protein
MKTITTFKIIIRKHIQDFFSTFILATCPGGKQYNADTLQCESCPIESFKGDDDRFGSCVECETVKPGYVTSNVGSKSAEQCTIRMSFTYIENL